MARAVKKLTALKLRAIKAPGRYSDGDGLYLYVSPAMNRSWVFRYRDRTTGKLRDKGLGAERHLTLEQARKAASDARELIRGGLDPIDAKREERVRAQRERMQGVTFGQCAERYIEAHRAGWRNAKHAAQWTATLTTYGAPILKLPVSLIDTAAVLSVLEPIWTSKTETATRVRQRIEAVLDWAAVRHYRAGENPARWKGHLDKLLPKPAKLKKVKRRAALPYVDVGAFMTELRQRQGLAPRALELQILSAVRPGEAAGARWSEFDLPLATWTIPGERMKAGVEHRVPLPAVAVKLLSSLPRVGEHVFPGIGSNDALTTAAALKVLRELRPGMDAHGFRSTFRDWAADVTAYPREIAEQALAHVLSDDTEAAYRRTDLFNKRKALMDDWAHYCERPQGGSVASIDRARVKRHKL